MKKFEFLSHTADVKIRVYGKNLKEIINNSLLALKNFWEPKLTKTKIEKEIKIKSNNEVNLLIDFLSEVLAETYIEKAIFVKFIPRINTPRIRTSSMRGAPNRASLWFGADFHADKRGLYSLSGKIIGYKFTSLSKDIKAITYHQANLKKINHQYFFDFIIDI
jgi:SHS2 domain-containing protein